MADQYSQPFYGLPFPYAPQHMQPPAQSEQQGGSSQVRPAPAPDAFRSIPGLQPSALPGINLSSYGQNSQQPPFPPSVWPPQVPPDPSAWLPFFQQNGMVPPPPIPGFGVPPPPFPPQPPHNRAPPMAFPPPMPSQISSQPPVSAHERVQEIMDSDREDGELSDGEGASQPVAGNVNGRARPEPPRSVPHLSRVSPRVEEGYNPDHPAAGQAGPQEPARKASQQTRVQNPLDKIQDARDEAKQFIKVLNSNNITYRTLANEDLDLELLRGLYQSLNLPSEPAPILPPKSNGVPSTTHTQASAASLAMPSIASTKPQPQGSVPAVNTNIIPQPAAKSVASPTGPVDRKDYIARLQAAKLAKQGGAAKASPPQNTPPAKGATPAPTVQTPQTATTPNTKQPVTDEQRARNTELIRQRLEAIKAKQKPAATVTNGTTAFASGRQQPDQGPSSNNTSMTPSYTSSFPGIPGLFMAAPPNLNSDAPLAPKPSPSVPQKRPAPFDAEDTTPHGSITPYTRPLGQSPHSYNEESMIIDVSDDESNGSEMGIDDDQIATGPSATSPRGTLNQRQAPGSLPAFPSRSGSAIPISSSVSTPGPQTPSTLAREKELEDKEKQLAAMRVTLKKKLAEKREKDKAAAAAAMAASSPGIQGSSTPGLPQRVHNSKLPTSIVESAQSSPTHAADASSIVVSASVDPVRDTKRLRRAEIQSRLPSLDAEIASNANRMAQLTQEMEQLMALNKRIAKDKEQLTQELESLGIDTEGMSHAELRAKKDEIEHETSPAPENTSQGVVTATESSLNEFSDAPVASQQTDVLNTARSERRTESASLQAQTQAYGGFTVLPGLGQTASQPSESGTALVQPLIRNNIVSGLDDQNSASHETQVPTPQDSLHNELNVRTGNEEPVMEVTSVLGARGSATPLDDDEDFYSPTPLAETKLDSGEAGGEPAQTQQIPLEMLCDATKSPSEEGEVEMSESDGEEEYEPEEPVEVTDTPIQDVQVPERETTRSTAPSQVSTEDEEDYEPPDVDQEMSEVQSEAAITEPALGVPQVDAEDGAMDIATSSDESSDDTDSDEDTTPEPEADNAISANTVPQQDTDIADDLAPELQSAHASTVSASEAINEIEDEDEPARFTPYESPLRMFKSYRYHPSYAQDVAGGFLSLTFSHQIDPAKPLCQYESAGGSCNDPECSDQHFRDIGITGEKLLVQLGTANPGKTPEEKQKWNDGLRGVLKELRQKNIKDPNGIALEIAKYRRQFLDDDTRVVNL